MAAITTDAIQRAEFRADRAWAALEQVRQYATLEAARLLALRFRRLLESEPTITHVSTSLSYESDDEGGVYESVLLHVNSTDAALEQELEEDLWDWEVNGDTVLKLFGEHDRSLSREEFETHYKAIMALAFARETLFVPIDHNLAGIVEVALKGDSNDGEHDALVQVQYAIDKAKGRS